MAMKTPRDVVVRRSLGLVWLATGCVFLGVGARQAADTVKSLSWPSTSGTIFESQVVRRPRKAADPKDSIAVPFVRYRYSLGGVLYHSTRISFKHLLLGTDGEARSTAERYK